MTRKAINQTRIDCQLLLDLVTVCAKSPHPDGGDNILRIVLFYLLFANMGRHYSFDASSSDTKKELPEPAAKPKLSVLLHNFAVVAVITQISIMYLTSGTFKIMGEMWQNGTAIFYIMQVSEYSWPGFSELIYRNSLIFVPATYVTVLFQIAFPFLLVNKYTKVITFMAMFSFHMGIALFMGLFSFSWIMVITELIIFTNRDYHNARHFVQSLPLRLRLPALYVFYDGWCPMCRKTVDSFQKFNTFKNISWLSFRDERTLTQFSLNPELAEKRMMGRTEDSAGQYEGIETIIQICYRSPLLWIPAPFLVLGKWVGLGQPIYDFIASRRKILPIGQCDDQSCEIKGRSE